MSMVDKKKNLELRKIKKTRVGGTAGLNDLLGRLRDLIAAARKEAVRSVDSI